jgi:hypothetical protein
MSRIRIIMLSLLAVFAVGVVASASASAAAPEFFHCVKQTTKKFTWTESKCVTESATKEGEFEKVAVASGVGKLKFKSTSEPSYLFANASGSFRIRCETDTDEGEITGPKTVGKVKVIFKKCRGFKGSEECPVKSVSPAGGVEEIITKELSGELGTVAAAEAPDSEVGLALKPTAQPFVELKGEPETCIPLTKVEGSVIGEVEPVKIMEPFGELIFSVKGAAKNKQGIQKLEGGAKDTLEAFGVAAGFESQDSITYEEPIEVT